MSKLSYKKGLAVVLSLISLISSIALIGFWINFTIQAQQRVNEAEHKLEIVNENLAQAYANLPWTLQQIYDDIDDRSFSGELNIWLKNRVSELRMLDNGS